MTVEVILAIKPAQLKIDLEERLSELSKNKIKPEIHYSMSETEREPSFSVLLVY